MSIIAYHGSTEIVRRPVCLLGRPNLDFGQGFYLTDRKEQAIRWAQSVAIRRKAEPLVNIYRLERETILAEARCKVFGAYDSEWLDFIVDSRSGKNPAASYDYIEGGIANDRVIDTVNLYIAKLITAEKALERLAQCRPNNQICLLNQCITDKYLAYERTEPAY